MLGGMMLLALLWKLLRCFQTRYIQDVTCRSPFRSPFVRQRRRRRARRIFEEMTSSVHLESTTTSPRQQIHQAPRDFDLVSKSSTTALSTTAAVSAATAVSTQQQPQLSQQPQQGQIQQWLQLSQQQQQGQIQQQLQLSQQPQQGQIQQQLQLSQQPQQGQIQQQLQLSQQPHETGFWNRRCSGRDDVAGSPLEVASVLQDEIPTRCDLQVTIPVAILIVTLYLYSLNMQSNKGGDLQQHQVAAPTAKPQNTQCKNTKQTSTERDAEGTRNVNTQHRNIKHKGTTHKPTRPMGNRCRLRTAICHGNSRICGYPETILCGYIKKR
ncbi:hypothetical protein FSP39_006305 [Pinctada imbricata]|uniref:Uncharacterized protein n=1 Tax=Pinctada imbricata TaxID=66713 RepID=A0AA89CBX4_PINIB|nr:hypothetical protein FSP39_006305 [Pinctada imbricata]